MEGVFSGLFASKPAPTLDLGRTQIMCSPKIPCGSGLAREEAGLSTTRPAVRPLNKHCLKDTSRYSLRLHILAPLPTTAPESAGLCALGAGSIVSGSLTNQRSGFAAQVNQGAQRHRSFSDDVFRSLNCVMAAVRGRSSGLPGSLIPGLRTCVQLPPIFVSQRTVAAPLIKEHYYV